MLWQLRVKDKDNDLSCHSVKNLPTISEFLQSSQPSLLSWKNKKCDKLRNLHHDVSCTDTRLCHLDKFMDATLYPKIMIIIIITIKINISGKL